MSTSEERKRSFPGRRAGALFLLCASACLVVAGPEAPLAWAQKMPVLPPQNGYNIGNLAYDFTLKDLDGRSHSLKGFRGKGVVQVVFWATWCMPCIQEIPRLRVLYDKYHDRGLEVFGVAVDLNQTPEGVRSFARDLEVNYPILWDEGHATMSRYGVAALPRNFLIGKDGIIRHAGTALPGGYEALIERLLGDESPPLSAAH